jgi:hypothetical protein
VLENDTKVGSEMDKGSRQSGRAKEILHFFAKPGPVTVKVHQKSRSLFFFYSVQYGSDSSPKELIFLLSQVLIRTTTLSIQKKNPMMFHSIEELKP